MLTAAYENTHLRPSAYRALGLLAAVIGLAASAVACWFFTLGLQQTERDALAQQALIAAGVLLTLCQLAAFGTAALLPVLLLRRLRWTLLLLGGVLFAFEVATMAVTQLALLRSADTLASAADARAAELRRAIDSLRETASGLRDNAAAQSRSRIAASREAGAAALHQALDVEARIEPLAAELARIEAARRPTLSTLLGDERMTWFAVTRSALIALVGLAMMSAAGALFRVARGVRPQATLRSVAPMPATPPFVTRRAPAPAASGRLAAAAAVPLAAFAAAVPARAPAAQPSTPAAAAAPRVTDAAQAVQPVAPQGPAQPQEGPAAAFTADLHAEAPAPALQARRGRMRPLRGGRADTGVKDGEDTRFRRVRAAIEAGTLKPSVRAIQAAHGGATEVARRYLAQLETEGVVRRLEIGRGFELVGNQQPAG